MPAAVMMPRQETLPTGKLMQCKSVVGNIQSACIANIHGSTQPDANAYGEDIACLRLSPGITSFLANEPTPSAAMTMSQANNASPKGVWHVTVTPDSSCVSFVTLWLNLTVPSGRA